MTRLLIVGPPGAGKGTQSVKLAEFFGIPAISTGDIFRWNIANETELGLKVKAIVDGGDYVPDSLTNSLVDDRLHQEDARDGFLLDGYPRTVDQANFLEQVLKDDGTQLDAVIQLEADLDEVVSRLRKRALEQGRSDDTEEAIRHRQDVFAEQTAPLLNLYADSGLLVSVDGLGQVDEVFARIIEALEARGVRRKSIYKSPADLRAMLLPSEINARALAATTAAVRAGVTTLELNAIAEKVIRDAGAEPNFAHVPGYQHSICANVNDTVVHGIPNDVPLQPGDMVTIDCGAEINGWHSDAARTVVIPNPDAEDLVAERQALSDATQQAMWVGIAALAEAQYLNDIGPKIQQYIEDNTAYGIVEEYIGHGIGRSMHEDPPVFNYAVRGNGPEVKPGLVVCIEPIIAGGGIRTRVFEDGWTVKTVDGKDACQWEQTVAVHTDGIWVLTEPDGGRAKLAQFGITPTPIA